MPRPTPFPLGACAAGGPLLSSACLQTAAAAFGAAPPLHPHHPAPKQRRLQTPRQSQATWLPSGLASERPGPIGSGQRAWWLAWEQVGEVQGLLLGWASALASPGLGLWARLGALACPSPCSLLHLGLQCLEFFLITGKNVLFIYILFIVKSNKDDKLSEWCAYHQLRVVLVHVDCCYFFVMLLR